MAVIPECDEGGAGCDSVRLGLRPPSWVPVLAATVVLFEDDGRKLGLLNLDFLNLRLANDFFVMIWAVTGLATWGALGVRVVGGLTSSIGRSMGGASSAGIRLRGMTPRECMINDPGLRTVVGIDIPMSNGVRVGLKVVRAFGTLRFSCKGGECSSAIC